MLLWVAGANILSWLPFSRLSWRWSRSHEMESVMTPMETNVTLGSWSKYIEPVWLPFSRLSWRWSQSHGSYGVHVQTHVTSHSKSEYICHVTINHFSKILILKEVTLFCKRIKKMRCQISSIAQSEYSQKYCLIWMS